MKDKRSWNEFKEGASEWPPHLSRREFLELAGATLALAGITACTRPPRDPVFPYVERPEDLVPGQPTYFATARVLGGGATGVLVETHLGRPTKIEGNPDHPASRGAASAWLQASLLSLYDPDRKKDVKFKSKKSSWPDFQKSWNAISSKLKSSQGDGLVIISDLTNSPTLLEQMQQLKKQFPRLRWLHYDPLFRPASLEASKEVFTKPLSPVFQFKEADVIVSFDSDFLASPEFPISYSMDFMERRRQFDQGKPINQLFVFESGISLTGLKANQRQVLPNSQIEGLAWQIHTLLQNPNSKTLESLAFLIALIRKHQGRCLFLAGPQQSRTVHSVCHYLNSVYGKEAVKHIPAATPLAEAGRQSLFSLQKEFTSRRIQALFFLGTNPIYSLPPELGFQEMIQHSEFSAHLGLHEDETAKNCQWSLPLSDDFEAWSDATSFDGSTSILQPVIQPLYDTRNIHELIHFLSTSRELKSYQIVRSFWQKRWTSSFDSNWIQALKKGVIEKTSASPVAVSARAPKQPISKPAPLSSSFEIVWKPSLSLYDGRFANNPWLQELPDPLTQVTWDNVALIGSSTIAGKPVKNGQILEIKTNGKVMEVPAWIASGVEPKSIVLTVGYGRDDIGKIANQVGFNAFHLQNQENPDFSIGEITVKDKFAVLACAQTDRNLEGREPIKTSETVRLQKTEGSLYPESPSAGPTEAAWAMTIDLDSCIGCSACVIACQSENNIPVVGKKGVLMGREMHWIRVDRYENAGFQPVPCMHCEKAPCEPVCPVAATVHGNGGLNQMIYNRCVGTRYCSNNCPYKVRRFNFLHFSSFSDLEKLQKNPDVSIRPRGVMEKCTYCVQRINHARIQAKLQDRKIQDGEIQTACQQTCPTRAITFGDLSNSKSQVARMKSSPRNYSLLEELGTRPRTTYLAVLSTKDLKGDGNA